MDRLESRFQSARDRKDALIALLNKQLADTIDLRLQARQAYFNSDGPYAAKLRSVLDGMTKQLRVCEDVIAEIITAFGGYPLAAVRVSHISNNWARHEK